MKISEILWNAANHQLWDGRNMQDFKYCFDYYHTTQENIAARAVEKQLYSCDAFHPDYAPGVRFEDKDIVEDFLWQLGLVCNSMNAFKEFQAGEERQGARYAWLMFASMIAEEEGL